jgi:glycine oxidase
LPVERLTAREVRALEPQVSARVRSALRFPLDGQVENRRLVRALAEACRKRGVRILTSTEARAIRIDDGRATSIETSRGTTRFSSVVVACGAWSSLLPLDVSPAAAVRGDDATRPRIEPVRGQILCFAGSAQSPLVRHVVYSPRGYLVPRRDGRLLAGTTTEHAGFDKSLTVAGREAIETWAREIAPGVERLIVTDAWAGLRPHGADDWPVLGALDDVPNLFYATAHYRNGILLAPLTGALVAGMILRRGDGGTTPPPLEAFTPERFRRASSCAV